MIVPMMKYSLVLFYKDYRPFLEQLQDLGLVDITVSAWEPNDSERFLISNIEKYKNAVSNLKALTENTTGSSKSQLDLSVGKALERYVGAAERLEKFELALARAAKEKEELLPWGDFDVDCIEQLRQGDIDLHFYELNEKRFAEFKATWGEKYVIEEINAINGRIFFVLVAPLSEELDVDLLELPTPTKAYSDVVLDIQSIEKEIAQQKEHINATIPYIKNFEEEIARLSNNLHLSQVENSGEKVADGKLVVLEGWATADTQSPVETMLDNSGAFYIKSNPTPEDETPVKLKNNKFAQLFEFIGGFYALPKYGTTDMTPFFAPFYMLFFGFCLGDGGYGLLFLLFGVLLLTKARNESMRRIGKLTICCGLSTVLFGVLTGLFFGIQLANIAVFEPYKDMFLDEQKLFALALAFGFIHLLVAMAVKIYSKAKYFGFKYALSSLGWFIVIVSSLAAALLPTFGIAFDMQSIYYLVLLGIGVFLMFFCNSPGKNPVVNFGVGLWNTYNDVSGLLGDILSYIRLFALGLAGGILAMVFNDLAMGMSPDIPVVKQIVMLLILLIGHGINLFMASLGAFVHPMRLTFVEFYKNAGFEAGQRAFTPLKK